MEQSANSCCQFNGEGGCANEGVSYPILCLPPPRPYAKRLAARSAMMVRVCNVCANMVTIDNFLIDEARKKIATGFIMQGKMVPDFDRAWLEWGSVGDEMWDEVSSVVARTPRTKLS